MEDSAMPRKKNAGCSSILLLPVKILLSPFSLLAWFVNGITPKKHGKASPFLKKYGTRVKRPGRARGSKRYMD
jgi:hypothetical protein